MQYSQKRKTARYSWDDYVTWPDDERWEGHDHHFGQPEEPGLRFASSAPSRLRRLFGNDLWERRPRRDHWPHPWRYRVDRGEGAAPTTQ